MVHFLTKIISGGQTGADRAALDFAIAHGMPHGGWIPKGRRTENGPLPLRYRLKEMTSSSYPARTRQNVIDSDGTLIISHGGLKGGSAYTRECARKEKRPWLHIALNDENMAGMAKIVRGWISGNKITVLNIAGPRLSEDPKIYADTVRLLEMVLTLQNT